MKKLIVIALLCFLGATVKGQSLNKISSYPASYNNSGYASDPVLTLDSLTGYLHYSYTVNYPVGAQRTDINWGGSYIGISLSLNIYPYNIELYYFNNETEDYNTLPSGQVVHSGSIYIGNTYNFLNLVSIAVGTSFNYFSDPYNFENGYNNYEEYEFIP